MRASMFSKLSNCIVCALQSKAEPDTQYSNLQRGESGGKKLNGTSQNEADAGTRLTRTSRLRYEKGDSECANTFPFLHVIQRAK